MIYQINFEFFFIIFLIIKKFNIKYLKTKFKCVKEFKAETLLENSIKPKSDIKLLQLHKINI